MPAVLGEPQLQKIGGLGDLDTNSLIDVHENLVLAATKQKKSSPFLYYQTHIS